MQSQKQKTQSEAFEAISRGGRGRHYTSYGIAAAITYIVYRLAHDHLEQTHLIGLGLTVYIVTYAIAHMKLKKYSQEHPNSRWRWLID